MLGGIVQVLVILLALYGAGELLLKAVPERPRGEDGLWRARPSQPRHADRSGRVLGEFDLVLRPHAEPEVQRLRENGL